MVRHLLVTIARALVFAAVAMVSVEMNLWRMGDASGALAVLEITALLACTFTRMGSWSPVLVWWFAPQLLLSATAGFHVFAHAVAWSLWVATILGLAGVVRPFFDEAAPLPPAVARLDSHPRAR